MSDTEEKSVVTLDLTNTSTLSELIQSLDQTEVYNIVHYVKFDSNLQTIIFHLQRLLEEKEKDIHHQQSAAEESADAKIRQLSEEYKFQYPQLLKCFKQWKPIRENLLKLLETSSNNLERISSLVSGFRMASSAADILGTLLTYNDSFKYPGASFLMKYASVGGLLAVLAEITVSKKNYRKVKEAIKEDQELFEVIVQWFKQSEKLDTAIRSFFPYGIDKNEVEKINGCAGSFDDYQKLFFAIVTSNAKHNLRLFKDEEFLNTAGRFAKSDAGKMWFNKVLLEKDPVLAHTLNSSLCDKIQDLQKRSPTENPELYMDGLKLLYNTVEMKITLNMITIISLWFGERTSQTSGLQKLLKSSKEELEKVQSIVLFLNPAGSTIDPILRE